MDQSKHHAKGVFYSVLAALMWGVLAIALKVALRNLTALSIVWVRFAIAFLILFGYLALKRPSALAIFVHPPQKLIIATVALGFNYFGFMKGLQYTSPGNAQVFIQLGPVLFTLVGIYVFKEKINWKHIVGFFIVLFGLGLFYREQILAMDSPQNYALGVAWVVSAAIGWAVYAIYQKELSARCSTHQLNIFIYGACALAYAPLADYSNFAHLGVASWLLLLFLGVNTVVAYGAIAMAFRYLDSSKVSVIITMNPVLTFLLMFLFGEMGISWITAEHFSAISMIGGALALGGAVFVILFTGKGK